MCAEVVFVLIGLCESVQYTTLDKKVTMLLMCKSESCDIEESWWLIQLRNRKRMRLATAATCMRLHASMHRGNIRLKILQYPLGALQQSWPAMRVRHQSGYKNSTGTFGC